ncbi:hypothetical protein TRFO_32001 [Tritrichomonas foetus]|uniref:Leucine Rich Repeat family protein n=1 Tax=Tritrichomonas foetus TaxID=1144522 RepID=A0A1J4JQC5_9EUKA|nr:hypothetical protein TRFO_32001 [Tritrichomonas foetus]|eukprot:OHT01251.1 hypothetical protein TRFO_32001 [Tritrichomonas foetus]
MPPKRSASVGRLSRLPPNSIRAIPITKRQPSPATRSSRAQPPTIVETVCPDFGDSIVLSKRQFKSFSRIVIPANLKTLIITNNQISDFVGFNPSDNLETLDISHNPISSLRGFPTHCGIKSILLNGCPLAKNQFYRIALILVIGKSLRTIDGDRVTAAERRVANSYLPDCAQLLRSGWQITYPGPTKTEIPKIKASMAETLRSEAASAPFGAALTFSSAASVAGGYHGCPKTSPMIMKRRVKPQSQIYEESLKIQEKEIDELTKEIKKLEETTQKYQ